MQKNIFDKEKRGFVSLCFENLFSMIIKSQYIIRNLKHLKKKS